MALRCGLQIEVARRARTVAVPTNEEDVKLKLRELGHPICLFGERAGDRRDRLRKIVAQRLINREGDFVRCLRDQRIGRFAHTRRFAELGL